MYKDLIIPNEFCSNRLLYHIPQFKDTLEVYESILESKEELSRWLTWVPNIKDLESMRLTIENSQSQFQERSDLKYYIFKKETDEFIGCIGLHRIQWDKLKFEIGYWLRTSMQGQGYMREAISAMCNFAFLELHAKRIEIKCDKENLRSRRVAESAGFRLEAILRGSTTASDRLRDTAIYSILKLEEL